MLGEHKLKLINEVIADSSKDELIWLNGYLSGIIAQPAKISNSTPPVKVAAHKITIAYGTETGNSKKIASDFAAKAKKIGINAKLVSLDQYRLPDLQKEEYFFTVISTQGEGEPPASAKKFYDHIHNNGFKLEKLKFGVLALGDTAYPLFCKAGEDIDHQLYKLGGERIVSLQKCDTDYESEAENWFSEVLHKLNNNTNIPLGNSLPTSKKTSNKKSYTGTVLANINLNDKGSNKVTHHIEIAADDLEYQPGDSIGIIPENPASIVEEIIFITGSDKNRPIVYQNNEYTIYDLLKKKLNIIYLPERVVRKYATIVRQEIPETKIGLLNLLKIYPVKNALQFEEVLQILEPTAPRLYSISSSPEAHAGEVHITVAKDSFTVNDEIKFGLCSDALSKLSADEKLEFYVHKNTQFKLPPPEKDIIMIGPGTGIAPFRSFIAERDATGAEGKNWLFFGEQHFVSDFLYQTELQSWNNTGVLTKLSVAFSRDQIDKVYVQHKMLQQGEDLFQWIHSGAYIYICGSKEPMSVDVENTLIDIISKYGKKTTQEAITCLDELKDTGRYVKDVY